MLVELLKDPEEKTRANSAGALGNFVRNSNALSRDLIKNGALHQLLDVVLNDRGPVHIYNLYIHIVPATQALIFVLNWKFMCLSRVQESL